MRCIARKAISEVCMLFLKQENIPACVMILL